MLANGPVPLPHSGNGFPKRLRFGHLKHHTLPTEGPRLKGASKHDHESGC